MQPAEVNLMAHDNRCILPLFMTGAFYRTLHDWCILPDSSWLVHFTGLFMTGAFYQTLHDWYILPDSSRMVPWQWYAWEGKNQTVWMYIGGWLCLYYCSKCWALSVLVEQWHLLRWHAVISEGKGQGRSMAHCGFCNTLFYIIDKSLMYGIELKQWFQLQQGL